MMKTYETFQHFWNNYGAHEPNSAGFHDWVLVNYTHTSDKAYTKQQQNGTDTLGFQPLLVTYANPFTKSSEKSLIKNVDDAQLAGMLHFYRQKYHEQFESRFGSFRPDEFTAFAEYDSWDSYHKVWLERDGHSTLDKHIPLLFDHTPAIEYWSRKQTGQEVMSYQRLLVTTYFAPKNQFFDFFIKNIDDNEMNKIRSLTVSRLGFNLDKLYSRAL